MTRLASLLLLVLATARAGEPWAVIPLPDSINGLRDPHCCVLAGDRVLVGGDQGWIIGIDCSTATKVGRVEVAPNAFAMCVNTDGSKVYCVHARPAPGRDSTLTIIDPTTMTVTAVLQTGVNPVAVCYSERNQLVYCADSEDGTITAACGNGDTIVGTWPVRPSPSGITCSDARNELYVRHWQDRWLTVLNASTGQVLDSLDIGLYPSAAYLDPATQNLYVAYGTKLAVIDCSTRARIAELGIGRFPVALAHDPTTNRLFLALNNSDVVAVVDCATHTLLGHVAVGNSPRYICFDPAAGRVVCSNRFEKSVSIIDPVSLTVTATIPTRRSPAEAVAHPSLGRTFVVHEGNAAVSVIAPASGTLDASLMLWERPILLRWSTAYPAGLLCLTAQERLCAIGDYPYRVLWCADVPPSPTGLVADEPEGKAYVSNHLDSTVTVYDVADGSVLRRIHVGAFPYTLGYNSRRRKVYCPRKMRMQVIDAATDSVVGGVSSIVNGTEVLYAPGNDKAYVLNRSTGTVVVVDGETNSAIGTCRGGENPSRLGFGPHNNEAYCIYPGTRSVIVIADSSNRITDTLHVPGYPTAVCGSRRPGRIFVADRDREAVYVFDAGNHQLIDSVTDISDPTDLLWHELDRVVYCSDRAGNRVLVINPSNLAIIDTVYVPAGPTRLYTHDIGWPVAVQCEDAGAIAVLRPFLGVKEEARKPVVRIGFDVRPNPARRGSRVALHGLPAGTAGVAVVDIAGRVAWSGAVRVRPGIGGTPLPLDELRTGVYLVRLRVDGAWQTARLVLTN